MRCPGAAGAGMLARPAGRARSRACSTSTAHDRPPARCRARRPGRGRRRGPACGPSGDITRDPQRFRWRLTPAGAPASTTGAPAAAGCGAEAATRRRAGPASGVDPCRVAGPPPAPRRLAASRRTLPLGSSAAPPPARPPLDHPRTAADPRRDQRLADGHDAARRRVQRGDHPRERKRHLDDGLGRLHLGTTWSTVTWSPAATRQAMTSASVSPSPRSGSRKSGTVVGPPTAGGRSRRGCGRCSAGGALELRRRVGDVEAGHAQDRRLQVVEAALGQPGGDLGAVAAEARRPRG